VSLKNILASESLPSPDLSSSGLLGCYIHSGSPRTLKPNGCPASSSSANYPTLVISASPDVVMTLSPPFPHITNRLTTNLLLIAFYSSISSGQICSIL